MKAKVSRCPMSWCQLWAVRAARVTAAQVSRSQSCVDHGGVQTCAPLSLTIVMTVISGAAASQLPHKSRSLRQSSVAKRLQTLAGQVQGGGRGQQGAGGQARVKRLSKYRRKTENAKERQRMKRFNEAFENLRQKLPNKELLVDTKDSGAGEKDTKV